MLRERLREADLRVTELADYLQISRPTLYNYIDSYDKKNFDQINAKVLRLFNYITENELAGKRNVINYILNNLVEVQDLDDSAQSKTLKAIRNYLVTNPDSKKSKFLEKCIVNDKLDKVIFYLTDVIDLLKKKNKTENDLKRLEPYQNLINELENLYK